MTMREIVQVLKEQGHSVDFYDRPDGGILIRSIDGAKFVGAQGNKVARFMTGESLSEKRGAQLESAVKTRTTGSKEIDRILKRVQREWNKAFGKSGARRKKVGSKRARDVRWRLENKGEEETIRSLLESERYAKGYAYSENVEHLIDEIRRLAELRESSILEKLANDVENIKSTFREEWIAPCYEILYQIDQRKMEIKEGDRQIRRICNLQ